MEGRDRKPIQATILGVGAVGMHAVQAASRYGDLQLWQLLAKRGIPGVQVTAVDYDVVNKKEHMREIISRTDILVDATQRPDPSKVVIPNEWIGWMPEHAVLVDLSVDPYNFEINPPEVKGIEGMPQGNGVISFSNSAIGGNANPSSIFAGIDLITAPATMAKAV
jgi:alanine dehydrogenase